MDEARPPGGKRRWSWLPAWLLVGLIAAWYGGSAWLSPTRRALGSAWSEAPGHLWGLWVTAVGLFEHGPLVRHAPGLGFPDGYTAHLMDPVDLILFLPGYWLGGGGVSGAVLGWNLLHLGVILFGGWGAMRLARELTPPDEDDTWARALLAGAFCAGAFLASHPHMGRTEYLPAVFLPWHLALVSRWVRGEGGWGTGVGAGLTLGAAALGGGYLAVFTAVMEVFLGLGLLVSAGRQWPRALGRLAVVAAMAALAIIPSFLALLWYPPSGISVGAHAPVHLIAESRPGTLLTLLRLGPRPDLEPLLDQPPYLGVVLLALALVGSVLRPRKALPWLGLALVVATFSLGPGLEVGPAQARRLIPLPAGWLQLALPTLAVMKSWSRMAVLIPLPLGVAAVHGLLALQARLRDRRWQAALGAVLVLAVPADQLTWPRVDGLDRPFFEPAMPPDLGEVLAQLPDGAVVQLPLEVSVGQGIKLQAARYHLWQLDHGRPVTASPDTISDTSLRWSVLALLAVNRQFYQAEPQAPGAWSLPGATSPLSSQWLRCARQDVADLHERGVGVVVLYRQEPAAEALQELVEEVLGAPDASTDTVLGWDLERHLPQETGMSCRMPEVPHKVRVMLRVDRKARQGPQQRPPPPKKR